MPHGAAKSKSKLAPGEHEPIDFLATGFKVTTNCAFSVKILENFKLRSDHLASGQPASWTAHQTNGWPAITRNMDSCTDACLCSLRPDVLCRLLGFGQQSRGGSCILHAPSHMMGQALRWAVSHTCSFPEQVQAPGTRSDLMHDGQRSRRTKRG